LFAIYTKGPNNCNFANCNYKNGQIIAILKIAMYKNGQIIAILKIAMYKNGQIIAILQIFKKSPI
jgi:hypothetical protein